MKAWHFVNEERTLRDGQKVVVGKTYRMDGEPELCARGYHASVEALDALTYAPGPIVCRVELGGTILPDTDKVVATERTVLWIADATLVLHEAAIHFAHRALLAERKAGREPDPRSWEALRVKRRWLKGKATDEELAAVRGAAWDAAWGAARGAAWDAAWDAARGAAWDAAWDAARDAARAARAAALSVARAAAWAKQNRYLTRRLEALA